MTTQSSDERLERFRRGEDLAVNISAIEKELTTLWKAAAKDSSSSVTRACLWNLVVHSPGYEESDVLRNQLETIYPSVPMRTLLLEVEKGVSPVLSAWVSARCHFTPKGQQICSEEVTIRSDESVVNRLSALVTALQVPDIPSAVWWPDLSHEPDALMKHFVDVVDRIVLDSSTLTGTQGLETLRRLSQMKRASRNQIGDLAWHRVAPWRSLTARLFDNESARQTLRKIRKIRVTAVGRPGQAAGTPALLFTGWFAGRLGWSVQDGCWRDATGGEVMFEMEHRRGGRRNELLRVDFMGGDDEVFTVELGDEDRLCASAQHLGEGERAFLRLRHKSSAELLQRELGPMGDDPVMWDAIDHAL